jgi:Fe-S oxidoreductase
MTEEAKKENVLKKNDRTKCTLCGICKFSCPTYKIFYDESISPRGKATMLKKNHPSKYFYLCTLCKACEETCILKEIDVVEKIREFRKDLVDLGMTTEANEKMIKNIREFGNPFGKAEPGKKIALYCC